MTDTVTEFRLPNRVPPTGLMDRGDFFGRVVANVRICGDGLNKSLIRGFLGWLASEDHDLVPWNAASYADGDEDWSVWIDFRSQPIGEACEMVRSVLPSSVEIDVTLGIEMGEDHPTYLGPNWSRPLSGIAS